MAEETLRNLVRERRLARGWSQDELARRAGLSRAGISAIETERLIPSAAAALALAEAFDCRVEDLFRLRRARVAEPVWAWAPPRPNWRFWEAEVGGTRLRYPSETTARGMIEHDGVVVEGRIEPCSVHDPSRTLVMACCDPAVGLLADELRRTSGIRLIPLPRSSRTALSLLGSGLVHVAGLHLASADRPEENGVAVRRALGPGYRLLRCARWQEGIAAASTLGLSSVGQAVKGGLRWIGREPGSGARRCLDDLLGGDRVPALTASDHRGVAEGIRNGWGDAGVCLRLVGEEAGLDFLPVREEAYDLCWPERYDDDERIRALLAAIRSVGFRKALGELPGYGVSDAGECRAAE